jgi:hypothetical protein
MTSFLKGLLQIVKQDMNLKKSTLESLELGKGKSAIAFRDWENRGFL